MLASLWCTDKVKHSSPPCTERKLQHYPQPRILFHTVARRCLQNLPTVAWTESVFSFNLIHTKGMKQPKEQQAEVPVKKPLSIPLNRLLIKNFKPYFGLPGGNHTKTHPSWLLRHSFRWDTHRGHLSLLGHQNDPRFTQALSPGGRYQRVWDRQQRQNEGKLWLEWAGGMRKQGGRRRCISQWTEDTGTNVKTGKRGKENRKFKVFYSAQIRDDTQQDGEQRQRRSDQQNM